MTKVFRSYPLTSFKFSQSYRTAFLQPICTQSSPTSAYVHLPFCAQKCSYCAFPIIVSGKTALPNNSNINSPLDAHANYVDLLCREISSFFQHYKKTSNTNPLNTLYLGGGTPSLMHPSLLEKIINTFHSLTGLSKHVEITCEMDPATFTSQTAKDYAHLGVNRASIGAQSFDDHLLAACNRIHRVKDIYSAVQILTDANINNLSIDLISGLPAQSLTTWERSLDYAINLTPSHISAYDLTLEADTPFGNKYKSGMYPLPQEEDAVKMISITSDKLSTYGYEHYEISNYAKLPNNQQKPSSFRSSHNMAYWNNQPFYAFGLGATSLVDGYRFARPRRLADYKRYVNSLENIQNIESESTVESILYPHTKQQSQQDQLEDFYINSFRLLQDGLVLSELENRFGKNAKDRLISSLKKHDYLVKEKSLNVSYLDLDKTVFDRLTLTEKGLLIENSILSSIMADAVW